LPGKAVGGGMGSPRIARSGLRSPRGWLFLAFLGVWLYLASQLLRLYPARVADVVVLPVSEVREILALSAGLGQLLFFGGLVAALWRANLAAGVSNAGIRGLAFGVAGVGLLGVLVVAAFLPFVRTRASWRDIDFIGSAALAAGLIPVLVALSVAKDQGWTSFQVLGLLGFGLAMLVAFFIIEQRVKEPIVPFALFKNRAFAVSMVVGFFAALGMFGMIIFVPLELQGVLGASVTNSGLLLTPMMLGLIVASILSGQLIPRIKHYHYLGTVGVALMMIGIYLLAQTTTSTAQMSITIDIVLVGLGLGVTMPLYINAVQSALPMRYLGVGTSQIQFWRNVGGTVSSAILGSILAQRLPGAIASEIAKLHLPGTFLSALGNSAGNPNELLDPARIAARKAALPLQLAPLYDQAMHAVRTALALTLHDLFLIAVVLSAIALIASLFMPDVPLRSRQLQRQADAGEIPAAAVG